MIKLKTVMAGVSGTFQPGNHIFDDELERSLVEGGYAEYLPTEKAVILLPETAVVVPIELAVIAPPETRRVLGRPRK